MKLAVHPTFFKLQSIRDVNDSIQLIWAPLNYSIGPMKRQISNTKSILCFYFWLYRTKIHFTLWVREWLRPHTLRWAEKQQITENTLFCRRLSSWAASAWPAVMIVRCARHLSGICIFQGHFLYFITLYVPTPLHLHSPHHSLQSTQNHINVNHCSVDRISSLHTQHCNFENVNRILNFSHPSNTHWVSLISAYRIYAEEKWTKEQSIRTNGLAFNQRKCVRYGQPYDAKVSINIIKTLFGVVCE